MVTEKQPSGNLAKPEDIGNLATYLSSQSASQIQGAAYTVDGAWTSQWFALKRKFNKIMIK